SAGFDRAAGAPVVSQLRADVLPRRLDSRRESEEDRGDERQQQRIDRDAPVEPEVEEVDEAFAADAVETREQTDRPDGAEQAERGAGKGQDEALGHELLNDSRPGRAE